MGNSENKNYDLRTLRSEKQCIKDLTDRGFVFDEKSGTYKFTFDGKLYEFGLEFLGFCGKEIKVLETTDDPESEFIKRYAYMGEFYLCPQQAFYLPKIFFQDLKDKLDIVLEGENED